MRTTEGGKVIKKKLPHHKEFNFLIISPTFGTQPTTEISQTTARTPIFKDDRTYLKAPQGAN